MSAVGFGATGGLASAISATGYGRCHAKTAAATIATATTAIKGSFPPRRPAPGFVVSAAGGFGAGVGLDVTISVSENVVSGAVSCWLVTPTSLTEPDAIGSSTRTMSSIDGN